MDVLTETHPYGNHPRQLLTVRYVPAEPVPCGIPERRAGLLMIHGGYWAQQSGMGTWPEEFARAGYVTLAPTYRLNTDAPWPACRDDVLAALDWARDNADLFHLDPHRIAALGSSAGGHLAASIGALPGARTPRAVAHHAPEDPEGRSVVLQLDNREQPQGLKGFVALSPPLNPALAWTDGADPVGTWADKRTRLRDEAARLAGCAPTECSDVWADMAVASHASGPAADAPALLVHYSDDLVPASHSEEYRTAQQHRGAAASDVQLYVVKGRGHGMQAMEAPGIEPLIRAWLHARLAPVPVPCGPVEQPGPVPPAGGCCGGGADGPVPVPCGPVEQPGPVPPAGGGEGPAAPGPIGGCCPSPR
ncbi:alpha/beta hydrolase [Streptomyces albidoflavus]|uniref:alpha/beta hydrolase n=1 Tax=Streptomyces albidoflavus TaxID=1886 RepID=UPI0010218810|nr:alpha/beta hydrolase [Streptomyces albidoflavus]RZF02838.1 hypothetical protein C0R05_31990 [Streptomyces albidoflavus]